jgi:hypothetical protein
MAVLPDINLALSAVRTKLGYVADWSLFNICTSVLINKWSKYKPVRAAGLGETVHARPQGDDGMYGLTLNDAWTYNQPRGGSWGGGIDEPGRLGDFRGYEHSKLISYPPVLCRDTDLSPTWHAILYPTGSPYIQQFKLRGTEHEDPSSVLIIPSDLGIDEYYYGIHLHFDGASWWRTYGQVKDLATLGTGLSLNAELVVSWGDPHYNNFPSVTTPAAGTCSWWLFISSAASAGLPGWSNAAPAGLILLPEDTDGVNNFICTGSDFDVSDYIVVVDGFNKVTWLYWADDEFGIGHYKGGIITCPNIGGNPDFTIDAPTNWTVKVYDGGAEIVNPLFWATGMELRLYPTAQNFGDARTETITLRVPGGGFFEIECWQGGTGPPPDVQIYVETTDTDGWYITEPVASIAIGSDQLTFSFKPQGGTMPGSTAMDIIVHDVTIDGAVLCTDTGHMRDNYTSPTGIGEGTVTLSRVAVEGDMFHVVITK